MTLPVPTEHPPAIAMDSLTNVLPHPVVVIAASGTIVAANDAAQHFFQMSTNVLERHRLEDLVPFGSPLLLLVAQAQMRHAPVNGYHIDLGMPRIGPDRPVDAYCAPHGDAEAYTVIMLRERSKADQFDRQLTHRGAARSVTGLAAMLAHEIKNPLSGIRGAAQLLESTVGDEDKVLTQLIRDETDRIVKLVDRMEVFSDQRPMAREAVNIHAILGHVKMLAENGFARHIRIDEIYDPSLPLLYGNRDQLVQVLLNLVKNAAEAIGDKASTGEIALSTAFRPGVRLEGPGNSGRISLPLEICVRDNGAGVSDDIHPYLFDPFVTSKAQGTGLGLALVAKIIGDHGGIIECDSQPGRTIFRILMPVYQGDRLKTEEK